MRPLVRADLLNLHEYERVREARRREIVALKAPRRIQVGRYLSFLFENRDTVWFQVQEMCRTERLVDEARVQDELDVYNALLPRPGELAASLMIEIADAAEIKPVLDKLLGIDTRDYVRLQVGSATAGGVFESGHSDEERGKLSAVHFLRFPLTPAMRAAFLGAEVAIVVEHPNERARTVLSEETKQSLARDLE